MGCRFLIRSVEECPVCGMIFKGMVECGGIDSISESESYAIAHNKYFRSLSIRNICIR
jgi:hypothetical protein